MQNKHASGWIFKKRSSTEKNGNVLFVILWFRLFQCCVIRDAMPFSDKVCVCMWCESDRKRRDTNHNQQRKAEIEHDKKHVNFQ